MAIKTGISGLRGTVEITGDGLTTDVVVGWVQAFAEHLRVRTGAAPTIVLGRDGRRSSQGLADLVRGALVMTGADVIDLGISLTPIVQLATRATPGASGGVMVTASHNPAEWNGLKLVNDQGLFVSAETWRAIAELRGKVSSAVPLTATGRVHAQGEKWTSAHRHAVLNAVIAEMIRRRRYRVALDACNSGAVLWRETLTELGCDVVVLHGEIAGTFEREPEPIPRNLAALRASVLETDSDIGLAADPDGDRLVLVDRSGRSVSEEHTVVLAAQAVAQPGDTVVTNVVTTHALEDALPGVTVVRTPVGEANVVATTLESGAVLGGEGSGGVILPSANIARDGLVAAALILQLMAGTGSSLAELVDGISGWDSVKSTIPAPHDGAEQLRDLRDVYPEPVPMPSSPREDALEFGTARAGIRVHWDRNSIELEISGPRGRSRGHTEGAMLVGLLRTLQRDIATARVELSDGFKVSTEHAWFSLRASNTEPIFRIMGESKNEDTQ